MRKTYSIRITWANGNVKEFNRTTGWTNDQLRSYLVRSYPDCQYIYMNEVKA